MALTFVGVEVLAGKFALVEPSRDAKLYVQVFVLIEVIPLSAGLANLVQYNRCNVD